MSLLSKPKKTAATVLVASFVFSVMDCSDKDLEAGREVWPSFSESAQVAVGTISNLESVADVIGSAISGAGTVLGKAHQQGKKLMEAENPEP